MRDTHPSPTTDRLPARLCHPCSDERIRALGLLFSDPAFLTRLDRRERVLARKYRWIGPRAEIGELRSIAFIRLSARLRKAPLWHDVPADADALERYLNTLTRNVFRTAARSARRRRRHEGVIGARAWWKAAAPACPGDPHEDPCTRVAMRDDLARLEHLLSSDAAHQPAGRDRRTFLQVERAYGAGCSSCREVARFVGTSHTEVRRLMARLREALEGDDAPRSSVPGHRSGAPAS